MYMRRVSVYEVKCPCGWSENFFIPFSENEKKAARLEALKAHSKNCNARHYDKMIVTRVGAQG